MHKFLFKTWLFVVLFVGALQAQQNPNVIVIVCDDAGFADFGFQQEVTGVASEIPTPQLDALRSRGVLCTNAYAQSMCGPSRAALVTGMYPNRIGIHTNFSSPTTNENGWAGLLPEAETIFELFQQAGYRTAAIGKWHLGAIPDKVENGQVVAPGNRPPRQGVDHFLGFLDGLRPYHIGGQVGVRKLCRMGMDDNGLEKEEALEYSAPWNTDLKYVSHAFGYEAREFVREQAATTEPFLLYLSFNAPHTPLGDSPDIDDSLIAHLTGARKAYASMMLTMDKEIGLLMETLRDPNGDGTGIGMDGDSIQNDTLVIFINDNGGQVNASAVNAPLRSGKGTQFEGGTRVPMILAGAGIDETRYGGSYHQPVHIIDILPTSLAAIGAAIPEDLDGVSLLPYVNQQNLNPPHDEIVVLIADKVSVRSGNWKMAKASSSDFFLYDLSTDIGETIDVSEENPNVVANLQRVLTNYETGWQKHLLGAIENNPRYNSANVFEFSAEPSFNGDSSQQIADLARWGSTGVWSDPLTGDALTLLIGDGYPGAEVIFPVKLNYSYGVNNRLRRTSGLDFMLTRMRFTGNGVPAAPRSMNTQGNPLLLVADLQGSKPSVMMEADVTSYTCNIFNEILLYDDISFGGNGTGLLRLRGTISDYRGGSKLTKRGTSKLLVSTELSHTGSTILSDGELELDDDGSITDSPFTIVSPGAILCGSGSIANVVWNFGTVKSKSNNSREGGMHVASLVLNSGALIYDADDIENHLVVDAAMNIANTELQIDGSAALADGFPHIVASYGSLTGRFTSISGLPADYRVSYRYNLGGEAKGIALTKRIGGLNDWLEDYDIQFDDDANSDGIINIAAYAFGANSPNEDVTLYQLKGVIQDGENLFTCRHRAGITDLVTTFQVSEDMITWHDVGSVGIGQRVNLIRTADYYGENLDKVDLVIVQGGSNEAPLFARVQLQIN